MHKASIASVLVVISALAACGTTPTGVQKTPGRPSLDSGFGFGSGNRAGDADSTATTKAVSSSDATAVTTSCVVTGFGFGSGNVTDPPPCTNPGN